jgi:hypothetical protein
MLAKRFQQCIKYSLRIQGVFNFENSLQKDNDTNYSLDQEKALTKFCANMWQNYSEKEEEEGISTT